ncbi:MAG: YlxR family protein [Oscillospiraceae bacterium]|nr:YlxR family protein [Oscillospiraceae bacterium]
MKKEPIRQCAGCRNRFTKKELLRVVRSPEGGVAPDETGKARGRGVYICREAACFKRVRKTRALERSLQSPVSEEVFSFIEQLIESNAT